VAVDENALKVEFLLGLEGELLELGEEVFCHPALGLGWGQVFEDDVHEAGGLDVLDVLRVDGVVVVGEGVLVGDEGLWGEEGFFKGVDRYTQASLLRPGYKLRVWILEVQDLILK
jgi:hypothetical protein